MNLDLSIPRTPRHRALERSLQCHEERRRADVALPPGRAVKVGPAGCSPLAFERMKRIIITRAARRHRCHSR